MNKTLQARVKKVKTALRKTGVPSALLISSAHHKVRSRDTFYPFRQSSDFFYLTGALSDGVHLLISSELDKPILFRAPIDPKTVVWDGAPPSLSSLARPIGADTVESHHLSSAIRKQLQGITALYYDNSPGTVACDIARALFLLPSHKQASYPRSFHHADVILEELRLYKSREELSEIRHAIETSWIALRETLPVIQAGIREHEVVASLEYHFRRFRCEPGFGTIVASGPSAATLHYQDHDRKLRKNELLLIDYGAEYNLYSADVTRMIPVSGSFDGVLADLYACVLDAQKAAIKKIRDGVQIKAVYLAAARVLTQGLKDFRVLRGSLDSLMEKDAYRPYFPHGIGHGLGLDVHDVGRLRGTNKPKLRSGMVFTVEPGLYFPKPVGKLPACGIRIEDDILVRSKGAENLSKTIPKEMSEIEDLMSA